MKLLKKISLLVIATALATGITSCGSNDDPIDPDTPHTDGTLTESITQRSCSLAEGAEVDASSVTVITLEYNTTVSVSSTVAITLNGNKVSAQKNAQTAMKIDIPVTLEQGKAYTLSVPSGAILATTDATRTAKAFTLNFKTSAAPESGAYDELCDASATNEAKQLYSYLLSVYGKKTISSVIANVNWNHQEADKIFNATGKYPAFNCYDFIHSYVPTNNWINYNDIKPVTEWVDAGGLVQLMWHFNVPRSETTVVKSDGSGVTCTPSETTFKAANALKEGTWENKWFYTEMDKVADVILKLQERNIAALWRPFHEGAGNATLKTAASWGKAWFWWGYDGADTYKKLWVAMYEHFQKRGIHNLIWVWTTQNYNGNSQQYNADTDWYPGAQYVDIVGRDLYGYNASQNATEYREITSRYPRKMVTLAECGNESNNKVPFSDVSAFWQSGAKWLYFMPWYGSSMPNNTWWKNALSSDAVITRDQVKM